MRKVQIFLIISYKYTDYVNNHFFGKKKTTKKFYDLDLLIPSSITYFVVGHIAHLYHDNRGVLDF